MGIIENRIVHKDAFQAVGLQILWKPEAGNPSENQLSKLWVTFSPRIEEIPHAIPGKTYGLERFEPGFKPGDPIEYTACSEVTQIGEIPEGMTGIEVPAATYAVITYQGTIDGINSVYGHFWQNWLPRSEEYEVAGGWNFEYYDERFLGNANPESIYEVWFPVKAKQG